MFESISTFLEGYVIVAPVPSFLATFGIVWVAGGVSSLMNIINFSEEFTDSLHGWRFLPITLKAMVLGPMFFVDKEDVRALSRH